VKFGNTKTVEKINQKKKKNVAELPDPKPLSGSSYVGAAANSAE
jgi:hypothetical protein